MYSWLHNYGHGEKEEICTNMSQRWLNVSGKYVMAVLQEFTRDKYDLANLSISSFRIRFKLDPGSVTIPPIRDE